VFDDEVRQKLQAARFHDLPEIWGIIIRAAGDRGRAWLGRNDRYYLLTNLLHRDDAIHPWLYERCREVEADPDGYLDLWAREHYKSTIITFAGIIQEILRDKEITIGVFSHTKGVARKFVQQVKYELEANTELQRIYPDVLYADPQKQSPKWSLDTGIVVKRANNPKEATLEGHGLVDGMPVGAHFRLRVYDDVVTPASVTTPEQVNKTTEAWSLSDNLGAVTTLPDGTQVMRRWHIGTRYSFADTYQHILDKQILTPRIYPATDDGTKSGNPVFLSREIWDHKLKTQLDSDIACQQLQNPLAGAQAMFDKTWLRHYEVRPETLNVYIMVDPASSKKRGSDYTAMAVIGVDANLNKYLLDGYRHKMNLAERWTNLRNLYRRWSAMPGVQHVKVGYEKYGMQSDIEHFESEMQREGRSFPIIELNWTRDGTESKEDRVQRLVPDFKQSRFWLPARNEKPAKTQIEYIEQGRAHLVGVPIKRKDHEGRAYELTQTLIDEFLFFPFSLHDDLIDACSRIYDMDYAAPIIINERDLEPEYT
jgi:hypothetical protein